MASRKKWPRGMFVLRGLIPGIAGDEGVVQSRSVGRVEAEKARARRRLGSRTRGQMEADQTLRSLGVGVFDRNAGRSELDGYTRGL